MSIFLAQIVHIIGGDHRNTQFLGEVRRSIQNALLFGEPVILHLHEEASGGKDVDVSPSALLGFFGVSMK